MSADAVTETPETTTTPEQSNDQDICIGIDLGTTYSCVAVWQNDKIEIIANDQGKRTTPSWVAYAGDEVLVGDAAKNQAALNPTNTVFDAKRLIGRQVSDPEVKSDMAHWPFKVVAGEGDSPLIQVETEGKEKKFMPEEISARVLMKMKATAESYLGHPVHKAVVTVPAYFNDAQRQATKNAGRIAGLEVLRIINEPTAAAIAYGLDQRNQNQGNVNVLIFDLGGGTFDVSLLRLDGGIFNVLATAGNTHLGGEDFDNVLSTFVAQQFNKKHKVDVTKNARALRRLRTACETAKRMLSQSTVATVEVDSLMDGIDLNQSITRAKFESLNRELFAKCLEPVERVLKDAGVEKAGVSDVVLVGGSTRIPRVQEELSKFFDGKALNSSINPDEAVAYGAAVQGAILTGHTNNATKDLLLLDVTPLSLGVDTVGGVMNVIIKRNTTIPCQKKETFTTVHNNQTEIDFDIYEGERPHVSGNHKLGSFSLAGVPPMKRGEPKIIVTMNIDANGILTVTAVDDLTKKGNKVVINSRSGALGEADIERMVAESEKFAEQDKLIRETQEARREVEEYVYSVREAVEDFEDKISDSDMLELTGAIERTLKFVDEHAADGTSADDLREQRKTLEKAYTRVVRNAMQAAQNGGRDKGKRQRRRRKR